MKRRPSPTRRRPRRPEHATEQYATREGWLQAVAAKLVPLIEAQAEGAQMPEYRVSCGWPARSALARKHRRIGECWVSGGAYKEIFITPTLDDGVKVADVLIHELCHAILPAGTGHKGPFARLARALGLEGKPTATYAGPDLEATLRKIVEEEGPYPHGRIAPPTNLPRQTTRMRKVECPACDYILRTTRSQLAKGVPTCPCGTQMVAVDAADDAAEKLRMVEQTTEYATEDGRFGIRRYIARGKAPSWQLVDFEPVDGGPARLAGLLDSEAEVHEAIGLIRDGLWTPPPVDEHEPEDDTFDELDDLDVGEDFDDRFLAPDEEELPDYPQDAPADEAEYEKWTAIREEAGRRTSEKIAAGGGDALD